MAVTNEQAIQEFYSSNGINEQDLARYNDPRLEKLPEQVERWLQSIDREDQDLFLRMLSRYTYLTNDESVRRYKRAVDKLEKELNNLGTDLESALFVTVESSSPTKSGSDNVRTDLHRLSIDRIDGDQITAFPRALAEETVQSASAVVFVDDIAGTGFTLCRTIRTFCEAYPISRDKPLFYICIIPTESGLSFVEKKCKKNKIQITPIYEDEWISLPAFEHPEIFVSGEREEAQKKIRRYEKLVNSYMNESGKSFVFGFQGCRLLVSFYYNTPNNTLCTFWRWTDTHTPLFPRQKQKQKPPRLSEMRKVKEQAGQRAYQVQKEMKEKRDELG